MERALLLARNGEGRVSPNPMVGAVIVCRDKIIGEGFHAFYGGPHAEVNAVNSVKAAYRHLLKESTMFVTLEPCAHYGKTPPCANLIVETGIPKVVISALDPNPLVAGKGIEILKKAGVVVERGILEEEALKLNEIFFHSQSSKLPWVILKWAQSADGFMAAINPDGNLSPVKFSSPLSSVWMHRERGKVDAIMVGSVTEKIDSPKLDVRLWGADSPQKILCNSKLDCLSFLEDVRKRGFTSLMIEGGPTLLTSFINANAFDEIRLEVSPVLMGKGLPAPCLPKGLRLKKSSKKRNNIILTYRR